ncbi:MAG: protein-glutamate O-methyltransferase CheR [Planctomycetota bacterium]
MENILLTQQEFIKIRDFLKTSCGIFLENDKEYLVKTRLFDLVNEADGNFTKLVEWALTNQKGMYQKLIHLLTTHETFWFRDDSFWNTLEKYIFPQLLKKIKRGEDIYIWCAGCSTGQEPYSIAILIDELCKQMQIPFSIERFNILATDISQEVLEKAKRGRYTEFDLRRGISECRKQLYFTPSNDQTLDSWQLHPSISQRVQFRPLNLIDDFMGTHGRFHLILCRNVLVYFAPEFKKSVLSKMANLLNPEGFLFLGASESIENTDDSLKKEEFENGKYYQKR